MKRGNKLILFLVVLFLAVEALISLKPTGLVATSIGIINQAEAAMYEDNMNDIIFFNCIIIRDCWLVSVLFIIDKPDLLF